MATRHRRTKKKAVKLGEDRWAQHFKPYEVSKSNTAVREGIDNTPNEAQLEAAQALARNVLDPVREHFGIAFSPESWFRCEALEKVVTRNGFGRWCRDRGIAKDANAWADYFPLKSHPKGQAADFEIPGVDNLEVFEWIRDNCKFDQLIQEGYRQGEPNSGWIHVSYRPAGNRNEAFDIENP
jgi:hypothetical protein